MPNAFQAAQGASTITGCQWSALNETGICSSSSAHRRFQEWVETGVSEAFWRLHLRSRGEEAWARRHARAKARRWIVERTHSWLNRFRSIMIRWAEKPANYLALLHFACGVITWRHALPG